MTRAPYDDARRVFWIVSTPVRLIAAPELCNGCKVPIHMVHAPIHASWLNQVEIYFSIVQRKVLTPNDFPSLDALAERLTGFSVLPGSGGQTLRMEVQPARPERPAE
jgi:hypothetical protein